MHSGGDNSYFIKGTPKQPARASKNALLADSPNELSKSIEDTWKAQSVKSTDAKNTILNADLLEKADSHLASCLKEVKEHPLEADSHFKLAQAYHGLRMYQEALVSYETACELQPQNAQFEEHLGRLWRDWGAPNTAIECVLKALRLAPESFEAWNTLGTLYDNDRKPQQAQQAYYRALDLNPNLGYVQSNLSYSFLLSGNVQKAIFHGEKAIALAPQSPIARNHLGLAYGLAGETEKCFEQFRELGGEAVARNNLGLVFLELNHIDDAIREFQAATKLKPFYRVAAENYRRAMKIKDLSLKSASAQKRFLSESSYTRMTPLPISLVGINFLNGFFTELLTHPPFDSMSEGIG